MRFKFLIIKRFSGGVVGEPGFPTKLKGCWFYFLFSCKIKVLHDNTVSK